VGQDLGTSHNVRVLKDIVSGPGLIAAADLVIGGGGTMNREAAVLGVPVWSVFTGPTPAIDEQLAREGRLRWVRSEADLAAALLEGLPERRGGRGPFPGGLAAIMTAIEQVLDSSSPVPA
jgi:predicted glycosyltransferase